MSPKEQLCLLLHQSLPDQLDGVVGALAHQVVVQKVVVTLVLVEVLPVLDLVLQHKLAGSSGVWGEELVFDSDFCRIWVFLMHHCHVCMGIHLISGRSHRS